MACTILRIDSTAPPGVSNCMMRQGGLAFGGRLDGVLQKFSHPRADGIGHSYRHHLAAVIRISRQSDTRCQKNAKLQSKLQSNA